jgi:energy-coupling factor transporter transmembrane protein EcfT
MRQMIKKLIERNAITIFFILPLSFFSIIGFVSIYFAIKFPENVPIYGWITILIFAIIPLILIYGFVFGFTISEKQQKQIEENQKTLTFMDEGITIEMPLSDKNCFINWKSIEAIVYYNYVVSSDFTEYYEGYKLYLNTIPVYTKHEKQRWLNKLFPKDAQSKIIDIKNDTKYFFEMPNMIQNYLNLKVEIDFKKPMKGTLISTQTYQSKNKSTTIQKWKPNNNKPEQIVFDKFNRNIEEIKKAYS